jgi:6-phosphofructokinase 1
MIEGILKKWDLEVNNIVNKGGTVLKSARSTEFRTRKVEKAYDHLVKAGIDALVVIGDGTHGGMVLMPSLIFQ